MTEYHNRTRRSQSIPRTLLTRGRILEIPLYYALRLSDLAREGLDHSGSHRFADHIYRNRPSGRGPIGRWLDARMLDLPAVRSFRSRYVAARDELRAFLVERVDARSGPSHILSVPCGIPRELADGARLAQAQRPDALRSVTFHGLDLDATVLSEAATFMRERGLNFVAHRGDALERGSYQGMFDFVTCTGLAEFLDDMQVEQLYGIFFAILKPGGTLVTSGMQRRRVSDYLLRLAEIRTSYRNARELERLARRHAFTTVRTRTDQLGIQTILTAQK